MEKCSHILNEIKQIYGGSINFKCKLCSFEFDITFSEILKNKDIKLLIEKFVVAQIEIKETEIKESESE